MKYIINFFRWFGSLFLQMAESAGNMTLMLFEAISFSFRRPFRFSLILKQIEFIGFKSVPIVILTGSFTGMVFGLQCYVGFKQFGAESMVGTVVALAMVSELGPVLSAIMVAARAGSAMTAEIGTMKVTEQIDALKSLAVNPTHYIVVPRLIASIFVMPLLNAICIFFGLVGGYLVNVVMMGSNGSVYYEKSILFTDIQDLTHSMFKAFIFGLVVVTVSCYKGFSSKMGAEGVGKATTQSVVLSCVLILFFDYIITSYLVS